MNDEEKNASASLFALRSHSKHDSAIQCANPQCSLKSCFISVRERSICLKWNRILTISFSQTSAHLR